jgi:S-methylmethionine-dependent homocysteine/selenocysteine methylase
MGLTAEEMSIKAWITLSLQEKGIKRNSKSFIEYERAKEIIQQYYPDYYEKGMKIAREMIGV